MTADARISLADVIDGRKRPKIIYLVGQAPFPERPDWRIFAELSGRLGAEALQYEDATKILREIHAAVSGFPATADRKARRLQTTGGVLLEKKDRCPTGRGDFLLVVEQGGFQHRSMDLSALVEGLGELGLEQGLRLNPDDLNRLGARTGDPVILALDGRMLELRAKADPDCPAGTVYAYRPHNFGGLPVSPGWEILRDLPSNPVRVSLKTPAAREEEQNV